MAGHTTIKVTVKWNERITEEILRKARLGLSLAGEYVALKSQQICPVKTGKLQASIGVDSDSGNEVIIGAHTPYAMAVEMGTSRFAPRAYLRGALDKNMIAEIVSDAIKA